MKIILLIASLAMTVPAVSLAAVSFEPNSGTGFVESRDVTLALGWTEAQLKERMVGITFVYEATEAYAASCTWTAPGGVRGEERRNLVHASRSEIIGVPRLDARTQKVLEGFTLSGRSRTATQGDPVPLVGQPCTGAMGQPGVWTLVTRISHTGGLFVNHAGKVVRLPY